MERGRRETYKLTELPSASQSPVSALQGPGAHAEAGSFVGRLECAHEKEKIA